MFDPSRRFGDLPLYESEEIVEVLHTNRKKSWLRKAAMPFAAAVIVGGGVGILSWSASEFNNTVPANERRESQSAVDVDFNTPFDMPIRPPLPDFKGAVFSGHLVPDADSVVSSIAGAELFDGVASITANPNLETTYLLARFNYPVPPLVSDVYEPGQGFVLLDHNAQQQMPLSLRDDPDSLRGIIDHHPFTASSAVMSTVVYVDLQVWGSCTTIIATKFLQHGIKLSSNLAGLLLGAIISDTLNFKHPSSTDHDKRIGGWLATQIDWPETFRISQPDTNSKNTATEIDYAAAVLDMATEQFQAKSNLTTLTTTEIILLDFKQQPMPNEAMVGWGQCETVDPFYSNYLRPASLLNFVDAMREEQQRQELAYFFVSFVDIWSEQVGLPARSTVVCISTPECEVIRAAFPGANVTAIPGTTDGASIVDTSPSVSRKAQFIPAISAVLT